MDLRSKLLQLDAAVFENVVYDLMVMSGLRNAVWRTPGADAGRDIEGETVSIDLSDHHSRLRWYIECKRYAAAIDWPTVFEKLAYAVNHKADYLFVVSTSELSPRCKEEVARHNQEGGKPAVRAWGNAALENALVRHPSILVKYGLAEPDVVAHPALLPISHILSKLVFARYSEAVFAGQDDPAIEYGAALGELLDGELRSIELGVPQGRGFDNEVDTYDWVSDPGRVLTGASATGVRTILSGYRFLTNASTVEIRETQEGILVQGDGVMNRSPEELITLSLWANVEIVVDGNAIVLRKRVMS